MQKRRPLLGLLAGSVLIGLSAGGSALAADPPASRGEPGLRDPRVPGSVPHISGMWQVRGYSPITVPHDGSPTPFLPWAQEVSDAYDAAEAAGAPMYDPNAECLPSGATRMINSPYPTEIVQTPEFTVILHESKHSFRIIHMDGEHPAELEPTFNGHSIGWWEGDTLVIDTVGLTEVSMLDERGTRHTDQLHVVERISPIDENTLQWRYTLNDPGAYSQPWTAERIFEWRPETRFLEYICEENNRNQPGENGVLADF